MSNKLEVLKEIIPTQTYIGTAVRDFINKVTCENFAPHTFRRGDVIRITQPLNKQRPSVIISVEKDYVISIPLTTSDSIHCLLESKSRFFNSGCFCNSYVITPIEIAQANFLGVYDNPKLVNQAIKELKQFINLNI